MVRKPNEDTEPRVQRLFVGSCSERGMGPQGSAGAGLSGTRTSITSWFFYSSMKATKILVVLGWIVTAWVVAADFLTVVVAKEELPWPAKVVSVLVLLFIFVEAVNSQK